MVEVRPPAQHSLSVSLNFSQNRKEPFIGHASVSVFSLETDLNFHFLDFNKVLKILTSLNFVFLPCITIHICDTHF